MKSKKNIYKVLFILFVISSLLLIYSSKTYATDSIMQGADDFLGKGTVDILDETAIKNTSDIIFNVFSIVGTVIVVVIGAILGIQFIMGSTEEKAKVKETLIPYIIGSVVIFGAVGIWSLAINVFNGIF